MRELLLAALVLVQPYWDSTYSFCERALGRATAAPVVSEAERSKSAVTFLVAKLERDRAEYLRTRATGSSDALHARRIAARRLRQDLRAITEARLTPADRAYLCSNQALTNFDQAWAGELDARMMTAFATHACPHLPDLAMTLSRRAVRSGWAFYLPTPENAYLRAQARAWLDFVIARGDLSAADWRRVLAFDPRNPADRRDDADLWPLALADAVDGRWSKIGLTSDEVTEFARRALANDIGGQYMRTLPRFAPGSAPGPRPGQKTATAQSSPAAGARLRPRLINAPVSGARRSRAEPPARRARARRRRRGGRGRGVHHRQQIFVVLQSRGQRPPIARPTLTNALGQRGHGLDQTAQLGQIRS